MRPMLPEEKAFIKSKLVDTTISIAVLKYEMAWLTSHDFSHPPARIDSLETINAYVLEGRSPGDFIDAILSNDLAGAFKQADDDNIRRIFALVSYCYNYLPMDAWGSFEKVNVWLKRFKEQE